MSETSSLKRRALGRGLGALIPGGSADVDPPARERMAAPTPPPVPVRKDYFLAAIEDVHANPEQPRKVFDEARLEELAQSIRQDGVLQPLIVRERKVTEGKGYVLIAGERRWRASQRAGLREVPVVVRDVTNAKAFELAVVENVQRADLNPIEEAEAYQHLSDQFGYTQEQIAERVGRERATVANAMRLLKLPPVVRGLVSDNVLSMGHARALLGLEDAHLIEVTAKKVAGRGLSVRATEELVRKERLGPATAPTAPTKTAVVRDLEDKLTKSLSARVRVSDRGGGKGGKIEIDYANLDDLDRLLDRLLATART